MVRAIEENTSMINEQGREGREASGKHCQVNFMNGHFCGQIVIWTLKWLSWVHSHSGGTITLTYRVKVCSRLVASGTRVSLQDRVYMEQGRQFCGGNTKLEEWFCIHGQWWVVSKISWCWTGSCSWRYHRLKALKFVCLVTLNLILTPSW